MLTVYDNSGNLSFDTVVNLKHVIMELQNLNAKSKFAKRTKEQAMQCINYELQSATSCHQTGRGN